MAMHAAVVDVYLTRKALYRAYWDADERHDWPELNRLGAMLNDLDAAPAASNKDAADKLRIAVSALGWGAEKSALGWIARDLEASDSPRHRSEPYWHLRRFEPYWHLQELELLRSKLSQWDHLGEILHIDAAITWLGRPRVEHCQAEGVTVYYVLRGCFMITRHGEPVPGWLSHLPIA